MCDIEACRICLRNELKLYIFDDYNLKKYYEEITNKSINKADGFPQYFCYECAALLHKYHTFREKCEYGEKILQDMLWKNLLTNAGIHRVNSENLVRLKYSSLDVLISNTRVKTFNFYDPEYLQDEQHKLKTKILIENFNEGSIFDTENINENLETNPVKLNIDFNYDVTVKEEEENVGIDRIEPKIETVYVEAEEMGNFSIENAESESFLTQDLHFKQQNQKYAQSSQKKRTKRITKKKKVKHKVIDSGEESDDLVLSKIKSNLEIFPKKKKMYRFNTQRNSVSRHAFLNNTKNWKRSRLSDEEAIEEFRKKALDMKYLKAPYKCDLCFLGFTQKSMLDRHVPRRHDESVGPAMCRFCKIRFKCQGLVNHHIQQHYNKYECLRCGLVCCVADSALLHEEYHSGVKRKCPHCDKEFRHLSSFYSHLRTHRSKHICALCGDSFVSELGLRQHRTIKHTVETNKADAEESVYCEVCNIIFESKDAYQNHLDHSDMHTDETKKKLGANFVAEIVAAQEKIEGKDGTYTHVKGLVNRKSMVEKELCAVRKSVNTWQPGKRRTQGRVIEPKAPKVAKRPTACKHTVKGCMAHHQSAHRGKPFNPQRVVCEVCGAELAAGSVSAHMNKHAPKKVQPHKRTQTTKKSYTCENCAHSFKTRHLLKVHQAKHTGERNYACTLCDKRYTHSGSLSLHHRTIHLKLPYPQRNRSKKKSEKKEEYPSV